MNQSIKQILSQVYELEGLLLLAENHGSDTANLVYNLIDEKSKKICELTQHLGSDIFENEHLGISSVSSTANDVEEPVIIKTQADVDTNDKMKEDFVMPEYEKLGADSNYDADIEESEDDEPSDDENPAHLPEDEPQEIWTADFNEPVKEHEDGEDESALEEQDAIDIDSEHLSSEVENDSEDDVNDEIEEEPEELEEEVVDEDEAIDAEEALDEDDDEVVDDDEAEEEENSEDDLITHDALQRHFSKNIRQAFSLNDKFRYRRELFGNSDMEMTITLNLVEAMNSYSEAEDYFYKDLEWDKDSPEVVDFMKIIRNHFA